MDSRLSQINTLWSVIRNANEPTGDVARDAQRRLWEMYAPAARRYLGAALRDEEAVDEVMQELAVKLVRQDFRNASPDKGSFRAFMKTVLFRMVADHRRARSRNREQAGTGKDEHQQSDSASTPDAFANSWRDELLEMAWARLEELEEESGRPWYAVLRAKIDNPKFSSEELAREVNLRTGHELSAGNYRVLLHRARERFASCVVERVAETLPVADRHHLEEELGELRLLEFCQDAVGNLFGGPATGP